MRGYFTPGCKEREWCERRLLARIHAYTLNRLRSEIQPASAADFMRFLFQWQRVDSEHRAAGIDGLAGVIEMLAGFEAASTAWEADILPARVREYLPEQLDMLCLMGRVTWGRVSRRTVEVRRGAVPVKSSPITLAPRGALRACIRADADELTADGATVLQILTERGALFFHEITGATGLLPTQVENALAELVARGRATADSFAGLRALLTPASKRSSLAQDGTAVRRSRRASLYSIESAGRWSALPASPAINAEEAAKVLLRRYGVVFRKLLDREVNLPAWRELAIVYRRLEARGEVRGGRFVAGMAGEQFALPGAVQAMRALRRKQAADEWTIISAADPLNLVGTVTPEERVPALAANRILFHNGVVVAALVAGEVRLYGKDCGLSPAQVEAVLRRRQIAPQLRAYLRSSDSRQRRLKQHRA